MALRWLPDWFPKIEKGHRQKPEPLLTWTIWSGRPDLNRRPLDPQTAARHPASATASVSAGQGPPGVQVRTPESGAVSPVCETAVRGRAIGTPAGSCASQ